MKLLVHLKNNALNSCDYYFEIKMLKNLRKLDYVGSVLNWAIINGFLVLADKPLVVSTNFTS